MELQERVAKWLKKGSPYEEGLSIFSEVSKNKVLIRQMHDHPRRYQRKLMIYLMKAAKIDFQPTKVEVIRKTTLRKPLKFSKIVQGKPGTVKANFGKLPPADNKLNTSKPVTYPPEVEKVKAEYSRLYNLRAQLHSQMSDVPADNSAANVKKRKVLSDSIAEMSVKIEKLYEAKEKYFEDGTLPDIQALFRDPGKNLEVDMIKSVHDIDALKIRKRQLQSMNVKYRNRLEYQAETKQKRKNPLPEGPQRLGYEKSIKKNEDLIEKINYRLVELAH